MSKRKKDKRHSSSTGSERLLLDVLRQAERAGAKAGRKTAEKALKRAGAAGRGRSKELSAAAEKTASAAARLVAQEMMCSAAEAGSVTDRSSDDGPPPSGDALQRARKLGQHILRVKRVERLGPCMVRVVAGAPDLSGFRPHRHTDQYVKVYVADPQMGLEPPYDMKELRRQLPREQMPRTRSYTVRWVDLHAEELAIDFAVHGGGAGSAWAQAAEPGTALVISPAKGKFTPDPRSAFHVFAADEAGLPAVSSALESLPVGARGVALLEAAGADGELDLRHPPGLEIRWLHRNGAAPGTTDLLADALSDLNRPPKGGSVMIHAERGACKAMARTVAGWGLEDRRVRVSSYWTLRRRR
ncbi:siderophore-interacting protein [Zhihengliuella halotolerans]|uniref:NADPH-dependent ferric siderophore reductase n=1 Tax=Zhihengliuella halotolerans TaxID=370736 RepID=A0A4Q8AEN0_9MICC|nr:siderophore-interacting protein [Zhihengliuella halotolerans]RZU62039.1 NADPH-dependent ferric siderophore reductase [Zhihengliuella halotolerans]